MRVRASLPHGALDPASRDAIVMELAREKTQMDRNRKLAKIKELMKREEEEEVGMLSCWHTVMWACCHVGVLSCWHAVMWACCHVGMLSCGRAVLWAAATSSTCA